MKTYNVVLIALFLSVLAGVTSRAQDVEQKTLLYEISGNGLDRPSYLFGTIHVMCQEELTFSREIIESLKKSGQIAFELDLDDPELLSQLQAGFVLDSGKTLRSLYSEGEYAIIEAFLSESFGQNAETLAMMKPFFITSLMYPQYLGCETASMELSLMNLMPKGSEVLGLESASEQLAAINWISLEDQAGMLLDAVENFDSERGEMLEMLDAYRSSDVDALYNTAREGFNEIEGYSSVILDRRNENWIPVMREMMVQKPTFFAVGAAHLGGERGVIELLKGEGYSVIPVFAAQVQESSSADLSEFAKLLVGRWKVDQSHVAEIAEEALNRVLDSNPSMAEQILSQRPMIEQMVQNTIKQYKEDGTYLLIIPNGGGTRTGKWRIDEENSTLTEIDEDGEESVKTIESLTSSELITLKEGGERRKFNKAE